MKLISLKIKGFKNLDFWEKPIDFTKSEGISIFVGNNGSGKSNVLEAISAIFYGLYDETNKRRCAFSYELEYEINGKNIKIIQEYTKGGISIGLEGNPFGQMMGDETEVRVVGYYVDGKYIEKKFDRSYLPSQIIALYSGEETRLYEDYYKNIFESYIKYTKSKDTEKKIKKIEGYPKMNFIDKDFWDIALLSIFISIFSFDENDNLYKGIEKILGKGISLKNIYFDINKENLKEFNENEITNFVSILQKLNNITVEKLIAFNQETGVLGTREEFFKNLTISCNQKDLKNSLILSIDIELNNGINTKLLSEGQKKQILIYFVTQILADKDSIILLDEPDSYIHVGNKQRLKEFLDDFLSITKEGEFIMTTHSPTLMNKFDKKHLFYLENGKLDLKEKREILDKITDGQMSLNEMEVFLNSGNKYLLVTEGITDKKHLEIAIEKLGIKNNYDIYSADGCDKLKQFLVGLPTYILNNKIIIGIFDYDDSGLKSLRSCSGEQEKNKIYKIPEKENRFGISLPTINENFEKFENFPIEFMYSKHILEKNEMIKKRSLGEVNRYLSDNEKLNQRELNEVEELFYYKVSESDTSKNNFTDKIRELESSEFINFKALFELIETF